MASATLQSCAPPAPLIYHLPPHRILSHPPQVMALALFFGPVGGAVLADNLTVPEANGILGVNTWVMAFIGLLCLHKLSRPAEAAASELV